MRVLVTGAGGMLAHALVPTLRERGHEVFAFTHEQLDVTQLAAVREQVRETRPDWVANLAAWTDVDGCEDDPDRAFIVNGLGVRNCSEAAFEAGASVLALSTDYVFDGRGSEPRREHDTPDPINAYGRSKLAGERGAREVNPRHVIVRTSWLFGAGGRNFVDTILAHARSGQPLAVVNDQRGAPTWTGDLARALAMLMERGEFGTYHVTNRGDCTWHELAVEACAQVGLVVDIQAIASSQLTRRARRPAYSVLSTTWFEHVAGGALPAWRDGLAAHLAQTRGAAAKEA